MTREEILAVELSTFNRKPGNEFLCGNHYDDAAHPGLFWVLVKKYHGRERRARCADCFDSAGWASAGWAHYTPITDTPAPLPPPSLCFQEQPTGVVLAAPDWRTIHTLYADQGDRGPGNGALPQEKDMRLQRAISALQHATRETPRCKEHDCYADVIERGNQLWWACSQRLAQEK